MVNISPTTWRNIYSPANTPTWTVPTAGAYPWEIYDLHGLVSTGTSGGTTTIAIPPPSGGWKYGSYRVYLPTLASATNFTVIDQTDTRFPPKPTTLNPYFAPNGTTPWQSFGTYDPALRGVFGIGPVRLSIGNPLLVDNAYDMGPYHLNRVAVEQQNWYHNPTYADPVRTREAFAAWSQESPTPTVDSLIVGDPDGVDYPNHAFIAYVKDLSRDGSQTFLGVTTGTTSGFKVTVYSPNSSTVVETFDNLASNAAAQTAINATSNYIRVFNQNRGSNAGPLAPTAIGRAARDRVASNSATFYSNGVKWFDGPWNEPQNVEVARVAHAYGLWAAAVKEGAPLAKTMGPGPVSFDARYQSWLSQWLGLVDRTNLDGLSVHAYNTATVGDVRLGRQCLIDLRALLTAQGLSTLPVWQTEQGMAWPLFGVERPAMAVQWWMIHFLLCEQYGIPPERNFYWYDVDNNFLPTSLVKANHVLNPIAPALRTLQGERHGKPYTGALDFGTPGNDHYIGNIYTHADGTRSYALQNVGEGDAGEVTFTVASAASLVRVDTFGNTTTYPVTSGQVTIPVGITPCYLRVPTGVTATVVKRDYGTNLASSAPVVASGGSKAPVTRVTAPGIWSSYYNDTSYWNPGTTPAVANANSPWQSASNTFPQTVTVTLATAQTANMAVIRSAPNYQNLTTLLDFDVQTSPDGTAWTTVYTYTKNPTDYYALREGNPGTNFESHVEQWFDERILWQAPFTARTVKAFRVTIRACTIAGALTNEIAALMVGNNDGPDSTYPTLTSMQLYNADLAAAPATGNPYVVRNIT